MEEEGPNPTLSARHPSSMFLMGTTAFLPSFSPLYFYYCYYFYLFLGCGDDRGSSHRGSDQCSSATKVKGRGLRVSSQVRDQVRVRVRLGGFEIDSKLVLIYMF